jgi:hypothetical protein
MEDKRPMEDNKTETRLVEGKPGSDSSPTPADKRPDLRGGSMKHDFEDEEDGRATAKPLGSEEEQ